MGKIKIAILDWMNYELAKKLKDAGFPQDGPSLSKGGSNWELPVVYFPILEELIEAMPMRRKDLGTINDAHFVLRKLVSEDRNQYWAYMEDEDTNEPVLGFSFREKPAVIVVANLYVALHEKNNPN